MADSIRFYALGLLMSAALLGVALAQPAWLEALGVETCSAWTASQEGSSYLMAEPDPATEVSLQRCDAKRQVVTQLLEGELGLFEAAARFRDLNTEPAEHPDRGVRLLRGDSDEEKVCRQVIAWTVNIKAERAPASEVRLLAARLEAELAAEVCLCGRINLPEGQ